MHLHRFATKQSLVDFSSRYASLCAIKDFPCFLISFENSAPSHLHICTSCAYRFFFLLVRSLSLFFFSYFLILWWLRPQISGTTQQQQQKKEALIVLSSLKPPDVDSAENLRRPNRYNAQQNYTHRLGYQLSRTM